MKSATESGQRVSIAWQGLPLYAAAAISEAVKVERRHIQVIATKPEVPAAEMDDMITSPVHWIDADSHQTFDQLGLNVPDILFIAGWSVPSFMRLAKEVRLAGGAVVCMADNSFRGTFRQHIGAIIYRAAYSRLFHRVWVPGRAGTRLMRWFGVPADQIYQGLYTADTSRFHAARPLADRPLKFTFVGQFIDRKNVIRMCQAFLRFHEESTVGGVLEMFGTGPLRAGLPNHPAIRIHDFASPDRLAAAFNESRCLFLPSLLDHWGVVVHEAASCGMLLIVSDATGAADDLCGPDNSRIVRARSDHDLVTALHWAASLDHDALMRGSQQSLALAAQYSPRQWADTFHTICEDCVATRHLHGPHPN